MAGNAFKFTDITVVGIDLSNRLQAGEVTVNIGIEEAGVMTSEWIDVHAGSKNATITATYVQDYTTGNVNATHWDLVSASPASSFVVAILPSGSTAAGNNPIFSGSCVLENYQAMNVEYPGVSTVQVTYRVKGALGMATS